MVVVIIALVLTLDNERGFCMHHVERCTQMSDNTEVAAAENDMAKATAYPSLDITST